jgi:hypothetical protein
MVKKVLIIVISVWIASLVFMPKKELYYTLEHQLAKSNIQMNEGSIDEGIFGLDIADVDVYAQGIKVAHIDNIDFTTFLFYNSIELQNVKVDSSLKSMAPQDIESVDITYSIINPLKVYISAHGDFGEVDGYLDSNKTLYFKFIQVGDIKPFVKGLKKNESGWYYEKQF